METEEDTQLPEEGAGGGPRKSLSMGTIRAFETSVPVHTHKVNYLSSNAETGVATSEPQTMMESNKVLDSLDWTEHKGYRENMSASNEGEKNFRPEKRKEYKSEYKKQFRPFSQYEYVDGKFFKKKGDQEIVSQNPWYKEVIELRKKAGEYRYRGWGTELVPQHLADVYHQNVWDQVSRRSSLAALALITTTTQKSISKEEKEKENVRKSLPKRSLSRPNTATPKHPLSDLKAKDSETVHGAKKKPYDGSAIARGKARSQSAGPGGRSPRKATRQAILLKEREIIDPNKPLQRHPRPTTLATSPRPKASSDKGHRDLKLVKTLQFDQSSADPSLGFSEPVIKSPPEPTRVKSPEQVILRSPDPVNWTVPLDTTKSFTVTQNIRDAPPSPRFRAGERLHGVDSRSGYHQISGQHSSAGSTKASSPLSSFSTRSGLAQTHTIIGQSAKSTVPQTAGQRTSATKIRDETRGDEKVNQQTCMDKGSISSGGGSGAAGPNKSSIENKILSSGLSSHSHSAVNGYHEKKNAAKDLIKSENEKHDDTLQSHPKKSANVPARVDVKPSIQEVTAPTSTLTSEVSASKPVPGTTLRCLEDPTFMFDPPKLNTETVKPISTASVATHSVSAAKRGPGGYQARSAPPPRSAIRVLEAPTSSSSDKIGFVPPAPVATSKRPGVGTSQVSEAPPQAPPQTRLPSYRVLDAPDPSELYGGTSSGGRNRASDVIEKARNRFDKFWGKSKEDEK